MRERWPVPRRRCPRVPCGRDHGLQKVDRRGIYGCLNHCMFIGPALQSANTSSSPSAPHSLPYRVRTGLNVDTPGPRQTVERLRIRVLNIEVAVLGKRRTSVGIQSPSTHQISIQI
jgi:nitrite reductase/ring-hydroxylating ferredoxin subunit